MSGLMFRLNLIPGHSAFSLLRKTRSRYELVSGYDCADSRTVRLRYAAD